MEGAIRVESTTDTELTPQVLAKAFWAMDDGLQAEFFAALHDEVNRTGAGHLYGNGEMQWCYLHRELQKRGGKALQMYLAMSVFAFEFAQDYCGLQQKHYSN